MVASRFSLSSLRRSILVRLGVRSNRRSHRPIPVFTEPESLQPDGQELTLRLEEGVSEGPGPSEARRQLHSGLMRLPSEIRNQIWRECLGGMSLHLDLQFGHYRQVGTAIQNGLLSAALTCRQMYSETINTLYEQNKFVLYMAVEYGLYLHLVLPPRRIEKIRDLEVVWYLESPPSPGSAEHQRWLSFWQAMSLFTGLEKLRVEIKVPLLYQYDWSHHEARLLEDIKAVSHPKVFDLVISWPSGDKLPELPCHIIRFNIDHQ